MDKTFKDLAMKSLNAAQQERPDKHVWVLLALSFVFTLMWLVEVIEKRGKDGKE